MFRKTFWTRITYEFKANSILALCITLGICLCSGCDNSALLTFETLGAQTLRPLAIVSFDTDLEPGDYIAQDHTGKDISLQVDQYSRATLLIERVLPNATIRWKVNYHATEQATVTAHDSGDQILFTDKDRKLAAFKVSKLEMPDEDIPQIYYRDGYVHPVWTPGGQIITDDYPPDHRHHHGIWAAWTKTIFQGRNPDFWNMGGGSGKVELSSLDAIWSGFIHAGIKANHQYIDMTQDEVVALNELWSMKVYGSLSDKNIIDVELIQSTATDSALVLSQHRYGGVGFRGHRNWAGENGAEFFTSEGKTRLNGHGTRARWVHIGGEIDGQESGATILSHPDNHEAPQPVRIHPTEPFFNFAPTQAGPFAITSDKPITWKYRFVTYDGAYDPNLLEALWEDYSNPLTIKNIKHHQQ